MTPNQLALLVDIHTGRYHQVVRGTYPATLDKDLDALQFMKLISLPQGAGAAWYVTPTGIAYITAACRLRVTQTTQWEVKLP